ncbi:MAG: anthranilate phosphoribosyltransferase [Bdellovibrionales bacterium]
MPLDSVLKKLAKGDNLTLGEAQGAFDLIFTGEIPPADIATFLLDLCKKGETVDELLGAVASMRSRMITVKAPPGTIDIVGTGGDNHGTFNISTAVAIVTAACGVPVAKHGNRAASSRSGSSDILAALGLNLDADFDVLEQCLQEANLCFLFAPRHHTAMKHVADVRRKLGMRTIFNLVGPLTNPANVKRHLIGVYELEWLGPMAEVLKQLGSTAAWLVHGQDGMDEITTTAPTDAVELRGGCVRHFALTPEQLGVPRVRLDELKGGDAKRNAEELKRLLQGQRGPYRDIVLVNTAAALAVAGKYEDMKTGMSRAADAIDGGAARHTLDTLVRLTKGLRA